MNKDDHEIFEAYDVQHEGLGGMLGKVATGAGKAVKAGAAKARTVAKKIPGADKMYQASQSDRYKDSAFGQAMGALNQAGKGDFKAAAKGLGSAVDAYQDYGTKKAAAGAKKATPVQQQDPDSGQTGPSGNETKVKSNSEKQAQGGSKPVKPTNEKKKPDGDGDGVPDWADKHHGEDDHEKDKVAKEGTKGTQSDREKADVDGDKEIEPWEKARANAIRKSQGKTHLCAKVVNHESFGPGSCVHAEHAIPDVDGNIEWYMVEFKHGVEKVQTSDIDVVMAVEHHHD